MADPHPILDAGRHPDLPRRHLRDPAAPPAVLALYLDDLPTPPARRARLRADHLPQQALPHHPHSPHALARGALARLLPPHAAADRTPRDRLYLHLALHPERRLPERNLYLDFSVIATARGP